MDRSEKVKNNMMILLLTLAGTVMLVGCDAQRNDTARGTAWGNGAFHSNGERIYFTASSERGTAITYSGGPNTGMMIMGGDLACASCHGIDARGGEHRMHMEVMNAPNIRWYTLAGEHQHEGTNEAHHHEIEREKGSKSQQTYSFVNFRNAVEKGEHPDGDLLSQDMPRWKMSNEDLHDLADYLKSLK
jgi:mono/diheme cytochrome c family protein